MSSNRITDDEFKRRYINQLVKNCTTEWCWPDLQAHRAAREDYDRVPRHEMLNHWQNDPEGAADETFFEWKWQSSAEKAEEHDENAVDADSDAIHPEGYAD